ncbi:MAG: hypothetical protein MI685_08075, partial [Chlorobiales bacterium]|nr:hypothetical protein [Chlorobiales bacterium]
PFGSSSFKVTYSFGMNDDADDSMILDERNQAAPLAFARKDPTFLAKIGGDTARSLRMTKYERALVRPSLESIISVPVFPCSEDWDKEREERSTPLAIMCIDSDSDLSKEFNDAEIVKFLLARSVVCSEALRNPIQSNGELQ